MATQAQVSMMQALYRLKYVGTAGEAWFARTDLYRLTNTQVSDVKRRLISRPDRRVTQ